MSQPTNVTPIRRDQEEDVEEVDDEIIEHAGSDSGTADALIAMKRVEPEFSIDEFITGARAAYEMILIGFARGEIDDIEPFLSEEVYDSFRETIDARASEGHRCEARFVGLHEAKTGKRRIRSAGIPCRDLHAFCRRGGVICDRRRW